MAGTQHSSVTVLDEQTGRDVATTLIVEGAEGSSVGTTLTGTSYSTTLVDVGTLISSASASAVTITVDQGNFKFGQMIAVIQDGAGLVTFAAGAGVTLNGGPSLSGQHSTGAVNYRGNDTWTVLV